MHINIVCIINKYPSAFPPFITPYNITKMISTVVSRTSSSLRNASTTLALRAAFGSSAPLQTKYDVVIVGGGPGGYVAAIKVYIV